MEKQKDSTEDDAFYLFVFGGREKARRTLTVVTVGGHLRSTSKTTERLSRHGSTGRTSHENGIIQNKSTIEY